MQKKYSISKEEKEIYDMEKQKEKEQYDQIYFRLHDLGKKIPTTLYGDSSRLTKLLELILSIQDVLDIYFSKRIATLSPTDLKKLSDLHDQVVKLNKEIEKNNYQQFKVIEIYMNDFLEQIQFINSSIEAIHELDSTLDTQSASVAETKDTIQELKDKIDSISKQLSEKKKIIKSLNDELYQFKADKILKDKSIEQLNAIIQSNKSISHDSEMKQLNDLHKELEEKIKKKQEEYDIQDKEYEELQNNQLELTSKLDQLKSKKGGRNTRKKRIKRH